MKKDPPFKQQNVLVKKEKHSTQNGLFITYILIAHLHVQ